MLGNAIFGIIALTAAIFLPAILIFAELFRNEHQVFFEVPREQQGSSHVVTGAVLLARSTT